MYEEMKPILFSCPPEYDEVEVYCVHDVHYGNEMFRQDKWDRLKAEILEKPNRYVIFVGDLMENAIPNSKSDVFSQTATPMAQQTWVSEQLTHLQDRVIAIIPGNHENNRSTKICGLYPLYDCALFAGLKSAYRQNFAFVDIAVGSGGHWSVEQTTSAAHSAGVYFENVTAEEFNVTMNMMYSDYYLAAKHSNVDNAVFYADMAKAFLLDRDGGNPWMKLAKYYRYVVK